LVEGGTIPKGSILIVEKFDRFSRNDFDVVQERIKGLLRLGISIKACSGSGLFLEPGDEKDLFKTMMLLMELWQANQFSANLSVRVKSAKSHKAQQIQNGVKKNVNEISPGWIEWNGTDNVLNSHASTIQTIFKLYSEGESLARIGKHLDDNKIPTLRNSTKNGWQAGTLLKILANRSVLGEFKGVSNYLPPVISKELFDRVQGMLTKNKIRRGHRSDRTNIFKGMIFCSCGAAAVMSQNGSGKKQFVCANHRLCDHKTRIDADAIEQFLMVEVLKKSPSHFIGENNRQVQNEIQATEGRISTITKSIEKIVALSETMELDELTNKLNTLKLQRKGEQETLESLRGKLASCQGSVSSYRKIRELIQTKVVKESELETLSQFTGDVIEQLNNEDTRKQLVSLVPGLVSKLVVNFSEKSYSAVGHDGSTLAEEKWSEGGTWKIETTKRPV
jgi:DNA invertase Pin-like site-specific DNA recombinase